MLLMFLSISFLLVTVLDSACMGCAACQHDGASSWEWILQTEATFHNSCIWVGHVILAIGEPDGNHHFSNQPRNEPSPIRQHGRCTENSNWEKKNLRSCAHEPNCVTSQQRARQCQTSSAEIFTECEGSRCDTANVKTDNLIFQVCGMLNI